MKKYNFTALVTVGIFTQVEATNKQEAIKIARNRKDLMQITSNNADTVEEVWMTDELDGEPFDINLEE